MIRIRAASFDDYSGIMSVMRRNGLMIERKRDEWENIWKANPAFINNDLPFGWVLESASGGIGGFLGSIPFEYELAGRRLVAVSAHAWSVDEQCRRAPDNSSNSFLLMKEFFSQQSPDLFTCNSSNPSTGRVFTKYKGKKVPADHYASPVFGITNYSRFCRSFLKSKGVPAADAAGSISGPLLSVASRFYRRPAHFVPPGNFTVDTLSSFDSRFDDFWLRLKSSNTRLLLVRDRQALAWYFSYPLSMKRCWIAVCSKGSEMKGYAVFLRKDNKSTGLGRTWVADLQALVEDAEPVILSLLSHGLRESARSGCAVLESVGYTKQKREITRKLLPWERPYPCWPFYYMAREASLSNILDNSELWDPCVMDGDAAL